ncbi:NADH:flavin oxidoreductase [Kiloniella laminariae]|uniref:NADH:flavin oxidoreductase n=1 Tax=Kiloniella laminariae TaxID=454162 RepID=A0ABT4LJY4_9PROT|nr:NADH:flavin oxidoreductase [Kiloniella laminariae]MCZ4281419.1 NADH:flavin oxidoreductase [Kiloniella laminariae]
MNSTTDLETIAPLFKPFRLGSLDLANRVVMAPMTRLHSPNGIPGEDVAAYYRRRAEGGVSLIITEGTYIDHKAANGYDNAPAFYGEKALAGWKKVVEEVHAAGGKIIPQIWHVGSVRRAGLQPDPAVPGQGPSEIREDDHVVVQQMSIDDIKEVIASYVRAALDTQKLGFDGIEIHAAHGYLIDQFYWEGSNHRQDAYGGSLEKRSRLGLEIVTAIRAAVGPDFPIVYRFSQWKGQDYNARIAQSPEELARILQPLAQAGVDVFHASTRRFWEPAFEGSEDNLATWARKLTGKPVVTVGSVSLDKQFSSGIFSGTEDPKAATTDLKELNRRLARDDFDLVAVGRALLSDPQWANKMKAGQLDLITPFDKEALQSLT